MNEFNSTSIIPMFHPTLHSFKVCEWMALVVHQISFFGMFEFALKTFLLLINAGMYVFILSHVFLYVCKIQLKYEFKDFVDKTKKTAMDNIHQSINEIRESIRETLTEEYSEKLEKDELKCCEGPSSCCILSEKNIVQECGETRCYRNPCPNSKKFCEEDELKKEKTLDASQNLVELIYDDKEKKIN